MRSTNRSLRSGIRAIAALVGITIGALTAPAIAQIFGPAPPTAAPARYIIDRLGRGMNEADARHAIAFRPFAPARRVIAVALLPPFHGDDTRANRGIGYEYADERGRLYALAQWPANGGTIDRFVPIATSEAECPDARSFSRGTTPNGIVWSTPHGLILTLQADGKNDARTLQSEWRKLIGRGVCR